MKRVLSDYAVLKVIDTPVVGSESLFFSRGLTRPQLDRRYSLGKRLQDVQSTFQPFSKLF